MGIFSCPSTSFPFQAAEDRRCFIFVVLPFAAGAQRALIKTGLLFFNSLSVRQAPGAALPYSWPLPASEQEMTWVHFFFFFFCLTPPTLHPLGSSFLKIINQIMLNPLVKLSSDFYGVYKFGVYIFIFANL